MNSAGPSRTVVIQTFRTHTIPPWIQRCLDSVRVWAKLHGHDYDLAGDEFYDLCGPEYRARGNKNPRALTNLARLVATRQKLDAGYQRVIWMDADVFVIDPQRLVFEFPADRLTTGYAFGREVWLFADQSGELRITRAKAHNAATFFTPAAVDLDMLISLIRHIDAKRELVSNYQVGVHLLQGLHEPLMFPTFSHVGIFSPLLVRALATGNEKMLEFFGRSCRYPNFAANLCLSLTDHFPEDLCWRAMDRLEQDAGAVINRHATEPGVHLVPFDQE